MRVFVATDFKVVRCNGRLYARGKHSTILRRYHDAFGSMTLCSRILEEPRVSDDYEDITDIISDAVKVSSLQRVLLHMQDAEMKVSIQACDLVIVRCHGVVANRAADIARKMRKPYFAEAMGCAWDAFWNHGVMGKVLAPYMFCKMKSVMKNADYALYVTNRFLQERYPCKNESVGVSNVLIHSVDDTVLDARLQRIREMTSNELVLMTTAAVDVQYKGQQYVIRAIPALNSIGIRVKYLVVGEGEPTYLRGVAKACGVEDQVVFAGRKPLNEVLSLLDEADIYIQPSLQEGLPRSVIEAMSRGCPVIGARTAGIPELIDDDCVVERKSVNSIVQAVKRVADKDKMVALAKRNHAASKDYLDTVLNARREAYFVRVMREVTSRER